MDDFKDYCEGKPSYNPIAISLAFNAVRYWKKTPVATFADFMAPACKNSDTVSYKSNQ